MDIFEQKIQEYVTNELPNVVEWFISAKKIQEWNSSEVYKICTESWIIIFKAIDSLDILWEVKLMREWRFKWIQTPDIVDWWFIDWLESWSYYLMEFVDQEKSETLRVSANFDNIAYHTSLWKILKKMHWDKIEWYWKLLYQDWKFIWKYNSYDEYFTKKYWIHRVEDCLNSLGLNHHEYNDRIKKVIKSWKNNDMVKCHYDLYSHNTFWESELTVIDPIAIAENPEMDLARTIALMVRKDNYENVEHVLSWYWQNFDKELLLDMIYLRSMKAFAFKLDTGEKTEKVRDQFNKFNKRHSILYKAWWFEK